MKRRAIFQKLVCQSGMDAFVFFNHPHSRTGVETLFTILYPNKLKNWTVP